MQSKRKKMYGMVHIGALPGTPLSKMSMEQLIERACDEASILQESGFDGIILENMHDVPYLNRKVGAEIIATMSVIAKCIKDTSEIPIGIQVLAGANKAALAIAHAVGLEFIRAEGYVFGQISDEGYMDADAAELQRYRRQIGAENVKIYCDIKKKHSSHALTSDVSISQMAEAAEFFLADGVIITGDSTGKAADAGELCAVNSAVSCPVLIGSGITAENLSEYWELSDGFIVGSNLKEGGVWSNELSEERCVKLISIANKLRKGE